MPASLAKFAFAIGAGLLALNARADADAPDAAPGPSGAAPGEQVVTSLPPGWKVTSTRQLQRGEEHANVVVMEPEALDAGLKSEQIASVVRFGDGTPPARYLAALTEAEHKHCVKLQPSAVLEAKDNGYASVTQHRYCQKDRRDGLCRTYVSKIIGGDDSLYVIGYVRAYACGAAEKFSKAETQRWNDYFKSVILCDSRRDNCPAGAKPPAPQIST